MRHSFFSITKYSNETQGKRDLWVAHSSGVLFIMVGRSRQQKLAAADHITSHMENRRMDAQSTQLTLYSLGLPAAGVVLSTIKRSLFTSISVTNTIPHKSPLQNNSQF